MRCMLYFHGGELMYYGGFILRILTYLLGGYFFGSTDQERFCIQRYARYVQYYLAGMRKFNQRRP